MSKLAVALTRANSAGFNISNCFCFDISNIFFLIFCSKQALTFHANCLLWRQYIWNGKTYFSEKKSSKIYFKMSCLPRCFLSNHITCYTSWSILQGNQDASIATDKRGYPHNIFLISWRKHMLWVLIRSASPRKTCCGYSLEVPHWGTSNEYPQHMFSHRDTSNEYPQHMFSLRNKKDISIFLMKMRHLLLYASISKMKAVRNQDKAQRL